MHNVVNELASLLGFTISTSYIIHKYFYINMKPQWYIYNKSHNLSNHITPKHTLKDNSSTLYKVYVIHTLLNWSTYIATIIYSRIIQHNSYSSSLFIGVTETLIRIILFFEIIFRSYFSKCFFKVIFKSVFSKLFLKVFFRSFFRNHFSKFFFDVYKFFGYNFRT